MNKAIFLDRDGVINIEKNYLYQIKDFEFIAEVFAFCRHYQSKGYLIIIITNQSGIARGIYSEDDYLTLNSWMISQFHNEGIKISKTYHCPHHPDFSNPCNCRKPNPGMILKAKTELNIDLANSILIGDKNSDIEAGIKAGIENNYLISTGHTIKNNPFNVKIIQNLIELT